MANVIPSGGGGDGEFNLGVTRGSVTHRDETQSTNQSESTRGTATTQHKSVSFASVMYFLAKFVFFQNIKWKAKITELSYVEIVSYLMRDRKYCSQISLSSILYPQGFGVRGTELVKAIWNSVEASSPNDPVVLAAWALFPKNLNPGGNFSPLHSIAETQYFEFDLDPTKVVALSSELVFPGLENCKPDKNFKNLHLQITLHTYLCLGCVEKSDSSARQLSLKFFLGNLVSIRLQRTEMLDFTVILISMMGVALLCECSPNRKIPRAHVDSIIKPMIQQFCSTLPTVEQSRALFYMVFLVPHLFNEAFGLKVVETLSKMVNEIVQNKRLQFDDPAEDLRCVTEMLVVFAANNIFLCTHQASSVALNLAEAWLVLGRPDNLPRVLGRLLYYMPAQGAAAITSLYLSPKHSEFACAVSNCPTAYPVQSAIEDTLSMFPRDKDIFSSMSQSIAQSADFYFSLRGVRLPACRIMMMLISPVMNAMLIGGMKESRGGDVLVPEFCQESHLTLLIHLSFAVSHGVPQSVFFERYLKDAHIDELFSLLQTSIYYQVSGLTKYCEYKLSKMVSPENVSRFLQFFDSYCFPREGMVALALRKVVVGALQEIFEFIESQGQNEMEVDQPIYDTTKNIGVAAGIYFDGTHQEAATRSLNYGDFQLPQLSSCQQKQVSRENERPHDRELKNTLYKIACDCLLLGLPHIEEETRRK